MLEEHVTDAERELAALLAVELSPDFAAGVRDRIATTRAPRGWALLALAAAAVIVVSGAALLMQSANNRIDLRPPVTRPPGVQGVVGVFPEPDEPAVATSRAARLRTRAGIVPEPEVIIDPALNLTVQRLLRAAQQRQVDPDAMEAARQRADAPPTDLAVTPVVIDELAVPVLKVGEPQTGARR